MVNGSIHILHLEDEPADVELVQARLEEASLSCRITRVGTRDEFEEALHQEGHDIILADFRLPMYDGMSALRLAQELRPDIPFIFVSGTMGEEAAIQGLTQGATDYVLKDALLRLPAAIERALQEAENRRERKRAERSLKESEAKMRNILDNIQIGVALISPQMEIVELNRRMREWFPGVDPTQKPICFRVFNEPARETLCENCPTWKTLGDGQVHEATTQTPRAGAVRSYRILSSPLVDDSGETTAAIEMVEDVTDTKRMENERERLISAIEQVDEVIVITDTSGSIEYVNPAFETVTGYTREEALGKTPGIVKSGKHDRAFYRAMWQTITSGRTWKGIFTNRRKDGTLYHEEAVVSPVFNSDGEIMNFVAVKSDITEKQEMEARIRQAQKMESIGTLAGGIAHDFNNILSAIIGNAEILQWGQPEKGAARHSINQILVAGMRAKDLTKQILTFSRQKELDRVPIRVAPIVKEALKLVRSGIPKTIRIRQDLEVSDDVVLADGTQILQLVMNLCANAHHAMLEEGGILTVVLENVAPGERREALPADLEDRAYLKLTISDTGCGMTKEVMKRAFDPYFTTKEIGVGTGLGLSVVHGIVQESSGRIYLDSEVGQGSTFRVYLPLVEREGREEEAEGEKPPEALPTGHGTILFVDDEPSLVDVGRTLLTRLGYRVVGRTSSNDALEAFRNDPGRFDAVVTDMTMPVMTGKDLAREILRIRPDIPIILCTGFSEIASVEKAREMGVRGYLTKPLIFRELAEAMRQVMEDRC